MFSSTPTPGINPDEERNPPPPPTVVYFPHNDINLHPENNWQEKLPDLFYQYSHISKPSDVRLSHLSTLNVNVTNDVDLETLIPVASDGTMHLPSRAPAQSNGASGKSADPKSKRTSTDEVFSPGRDPLLSNGIKAPEQETYLKFTRELLCENEDALRVIWRKKARPGYPAPPLSHYRKFWGNLESLFMYWDTTLDNYYELDQATLAKQSPKSPNRFKKLSIALGHKDSSEELRPSSNKRYKGRRSSTGSRMPEHFRLEAVRNFMEPIAWVFGCRLINPRKIPHMEIRTLLIPVTQTAQVWRTPQDKMSLKKGVTEGPVLGVQCRAETVGFLRDSQAAILDAAREIAGLMLLAQERDREGKPKEVPGRGKWYTSKARWGGGPGGEFGEAEGNTDPVHPAPSHHTPSSPFGRRHSAPSTFVSRLSKSEEEIWKELKPGPSLWDPTHTYLAVGKERGDQFDNVFMISSLYHHIAILKLHIHPLYIEFLRTGKAPASPPPDVEWWAPQIQRSRWYDLLLPEDRVEAMRGLWGVMSYSMRAGQSIGAAPGQRQKSEVHHHFPFRRKASMDAGGKANSSMSVAF